MSGGFFYSIWRRQTPQNSAPTQWVKTSHWLTARTDKEAESKMRRRFENAGFHSMQLVAIKTGEQPK